MVYGNYNWHHYLSSLSGKYIKQAQLSQYSDQVMAWKSWVIMVKFPAAARAAMGATQPLFSEQWRHFPWRLSGLGMTMTTHTNIMHFGGADFHLHLPNMQFTTIKQKNAQNCSSGT